MDSDRGDVENGRDLVIRQSTEEDELDDTSLSLVEGKQANQEPVNFKKRVGGGVINGVVLFELDLDGATATFVAIGGACPVKKNLAHGTGGNSIEVDAVRVRAITVSKLEVCLVNDSRRAEGMVGALGTHVASRERTQLLIDKRHQEIGSATVTALPCA